MKILSVNKFYYLKGGSETYFFALNNTLEKSGVEVVPFSMKDKRNFTSKYEKYYIENIDYNSAHLIQKLKYSGKIIYSLDARKKIEKIINETKPDLAHLHIFQHQFSPSILSEIKRFDIPIVNTVHDLKPLCPNYRMLSDGKVCEKCKRYKFYNCFLNKCVKSSYLGSLVNTLEMYVHLTLGSYNLIDIFITPSEFYKKKFIEYGYSSNKVVYIPNFIDTNLFEPNYSSDNYFLFFGRLSEEKGVMTLLKAMKTVKNIDLFIVGDGPLKDDVMKYRELNGLDNVKVLGFKSGSELKELIRNAKFTVIPSEWYENSPLSVLESMAFGKPVIGSNIGGIPEMIDHGETGLIFEKGNEEELAQQINYLNANKKVICDMGNFSRLKVEKEYNKDLHLERIMNLYKILLHNRGGQYGRANCSNVQM